MWLRQADSSATGQSSPKNVLVDLAPGASVGFGNQNGYPKISAQAPGTGFSVAQVLAHCLCPYQPWWKSTDSLASPLHVLTCTDRKCRWLCILATLVGMQPHKTVPGKQPEHFLLGALKQHAGCGRKGEWAEDQGDRAHACMHNHQHSISSMHAVVPTHHSQACVSRSHARHLIKRDDGSSNIAQCMSSLICVCCGAWAGART